MKKFLLIIVLLATCGYFIGSYLKEKADLEAEHKEEKILLQKRNVLLADLIKRTNAITDWEDKLSKGKQFRAEPILTTELEKLWLTEQPILFIGTINDISTQDNTTYMVLLGENSYLKQHLFHTDLKILVACPKHTIDILLDGRPDYFEAFGIKNGLAVVAKINELKTEYAVNPLKNFSKKYENNEIRVGKGVLVDMIHFTITKSEINAYFNQIKALADTGPE